MPKGNIIVSDSFTKEPTSTIFNFKMKNIYGDVITLDKYKGKKILIVNVASHCGYTSQYNDLQKLQDRFKNNLQVIAFPCNDFGFQEPGTSEQIAEFCELNYNIKFPIMEKINIRRSPTHPLYEWLSNSELNGWNDSKPKWNFYKYLIDENGKLINLFNSAISPLSNQIIEAI
ncbi:MAG: glutathione peroxidase [Candidatus Marinimicrobia bacterium]|nr:glutathione peroxidase [Candidatus Neomarinimicrobiota bacterium]